VSFVNHPAAEPSLHAARQIGLWRGSVAAAVFAAAACQLVACGGAEPRASGVDSSTVATPATLEGAEAELARLEASLDGTFGAAGADASGEPMPAPPPTAGVEPGQLSKKNEAASRCENACDALASMGRSANRICELAGPGDRCEAAKARVASATTRVTAKCTECDS
jgi:hypothetical protein